MTAPTSNRGVLTVLSGPSGAGKSTICRPVLESDANLRFSVSCTTRDPRPGEEDGKDYHFISRESFEAQIAEGKFLEHANVHGNYYGTLRSEVIQHLENGTDILLDIDVQGAMQIKDRLRNDDTLAASTAFVFVAPPSNQELERRLRGRGTEEEEVIQRRLNNANHEMTFWTRYDYLVIADTPEGGSERLRSVINAIRCRTRHLEISGILPTES